MDMRFDPGGTVTIIGGTHSHGQGHATVFAQLVHEWLGVPFETIRYIQGDTDKVADRPRHLRRAQRGGRRQRAASAPPTRSSTRRSRWPPRMMEAAEGDIEFKDGSFKRRRHRQGDPADRGREGLLRADGTMTEKLGIGLEGAGTYSHQSAEPSERLRMSPRSRSIRRPAR